MPLKQLEVHNFKSYKGTQTIGPFKDFSCVIGPNGSGKSNLMDAISFVLGVRSAQLRSSQLRDLIYRAGTDGPAEGEEEDDEDAEQDEGSDKRPNKAWVAAVYLDDVTGSEYRFCRTITATGKAGTSTYSINNKTVKWETYNSRLEEFGILVKARNFLVFQGDVEAVASQNPKDLAKLIDQISGSLDLAADYEAKRVAQDKAVELSTTHHNKKRGINGEIKQFKEQKAEAEKYERLVEEKDAAIVRHLLWKLFHIEDALASRADAIETKNAELDPLRSAHAESEKSLKSAKKDLAAAQKASSKAERTLQRREKDVEELKPGLVEVEEKTKHAKGKKEKAEKVKKDVERDRKKKDEEVKKLKAEKTMVEQAERQFQEKQRKASQATGLTLSDEDLQRYTSLKAEAAKKVPSERQRAADLARELRTKKDAVGQVQDKLEQVMAKISKLESEEKSLGQRKETFDGKVSESSKELARVKKSLAEAKKERDRLDQTEMELQEKLETCLKKLSEAGAAEQESRKEAKTRQMLETLQRIFPGVKGRLHDLCQPTARKYETAISVILGRNIDSIVVDTEKTGIECIEYLRSQRLGLATFIPLDHVQVKPVNEKLRSVAKGVRLAVDLIQYDPSLERAIHHACGSAIVCDSMEVAKQVVYERGIEVKAVTLEGTVIHKGGNITGGVSGTGAGRRWEEAEVKRLKEAEAGLLRQLSDLHKGRPRNTDEQLIADIGRIEADLSIHRDDLSGTQSRLKGVKDELKVLKKQQTELRTKAESGASEAEAIEGKLSAVKDVVDAAEDEIFAEFCETIGVAHIREYEDTQLRLQQEGSEEQAKFTILLKRLNTQIKFESEQLEDLVKRLDKINSTISSAEASLKSLETEQASIERDIVSVEGEVEELRSAFDELAAVTNSKGAAYDEVKRSMSKAAKVLDKAIAEISAWNDDIERLSSERFHIYRRCKLEEIDLPLKAGDIDTVPVDEVRPMAMDVDGEEDATQRAAQVEDYGLEVDFDELDDDEREDSGPETERELTSAIEKLTGEIEKMAPNMKSADKLGDTEARLRDHQKELDKSRNDAKTAKDAFNEVKKQRCDLFNKAFNHISQVIDEIYKDLTKGKASPMGGVAYLSLEDTEEPYLHGIRFHAMPPMKRFRDIDALSGGEKTMAAMALLFAIHSYQPSPFFVLDEVDAALDNTNVQRLGDYIRRRSALSAQINGSPAKTSPKKSSKSLPDVATQFIVISLKSVFYERAQGLVGVHRDNMYGGTKTLTLDLERYAEV